MKLAHTSMSDKAQGTWVEVVDTEADDKIVGFIKRESFPLGGFVFNVKRKDGRHVYTGNSAGTGLKCLADDLAHEQGTTK